MLLTINAKISAKTTETHIPSIPHIKGNKNIIAICNIKVLKNDIVSETTPLYNAVKNDELNI